MHPRLKYSIASETSLHNLPQDALHKAAAENHVALIQQILAQDPDALNRIHSTHGTTPICWAIQYNKELALQVLLQYNPNLFPTNLPYEHYYPIYFLDNDCAKHSPAQSFILNKTSEALTIKENNISQLSPTELFALQQGIVAVARCGRENYDDVINRLRIIFNKIENFDFEPNLKVIYLICSLLGMEAVRVSYIVSNANSSFITEMTDLFKKIPNNIVNADLSYALFATGYSKSVCGERCFKSFFDYALHSCPSSDNYFHLAILVVYCHFYVEDIAENGFDSLREISLLAAQITLRIEENAFKNYELAELFACTALKMIEVLDDCDHIALGFLKHAARFEPVAGDLNLIMNCTHIVLALDKMKEGDYDQCVEILKRIDGSNSLFVCKDNSLFEGFYFNFVDVATTDIINDLIKTLSQRLSGELDEEVFADLAVALDLFTECVVVKLAHIHKDHNSKETIEEAFCNLRNRILLLPQLVPDTYESYFSDYVSYVSRFFEKMVPITNLPLIKFYLADFLYDQLDYEESLKHYIDLSFQFLRNYDAQNFCHVLLNISYIYESYNEPLIVNLLQNLINYQNSSFNFPSTQSFIRVSQVLLTNEKWLLDLYYEFSEKIMMTLNQSPLESIASGGNVSQASSTAAFFHQKPRMNDNQTQYTSPTGVTRPS